MDEVIRVEHLSKRYGTAAVVDHVSFVVGRGEIFGIVGPNGAGKTTTVECIMGLRRPDGGTIRLLGADPWSAGPGLRRRIGAQLQHAALPNRIRVWEALDLFASLYGNPVPWRRVLTEWGLEAERDAPVEELSGGERQRLFVALALVGDPEVVFLDEVTTGLDPRARRATWDLIASIRGRGRSVVLVTHFLEEAERLCDRVAVMDQGRIVALDSPAVLMGPGATGGRTLEDVYLTLTGVPLADWTSG
jgi:ABC-2 type transport system ATP-binding protein